MNAWILIWRSLRFYWRTHLGILLGSAMGGTILIGALTVGDSVHISLLEQARSRLGRGEFALVGGDRFFRAALADDLSGALESGRPGPSQDRGPKETVYVAPVLQVRGIGISDGGRWRANQVQALGVDRRFGLLSPSGRPWPALANDEAVVNAALAQRLDLHPGGQLLLRLEKIGFLPMDAPLSDDKHASLALSVTVKAVVSDQDFGRFGLQANAQGPLNVYCSLDWLSQKLELTNRANLLLLGGEAVGSLTRETVNDTLGKVWQLADAGLELRAQSDLNFIELRSHRIFIEDRIVEVARQVDTGVRGILSYFVNEIRAGARSTPYSMVSAPGAPLVPAGMANDEMIVNDWLARDLEVQPGGTVEMAYYLLGPGRQLIEKTNRFRIRAVVSMTGMAADRSLMPSFPGLADVSNCRDWDPGIPIDLSKIRKTDEDYWNQYRGTPKAFVTLPEAEALWTNRFGQWTAIRFPLRDSLSSAQIAGEILRRLKPGDLGLELRPVRAEGMEAGAGSVDFGQLFLGLSFFLEMAALLLTGLLFVFGVEQRAEELGTLLALGFPAALVRRLWLAEGAVLAALGSLLGVLGGVFYTAVVLHALGSIWQGAIGHFSLGFHLQMTTLAMGVMLSFGAALLAMVLAIRKQVRRSVVELQSAGAAGVSMGRGTGRIAIGLAVGCAGTAAVLLMRTDPGRGPEAAGSFFAVGSLVLLGGLSLAHGWISRMGQGRSGIRLDLFRLGISNCLRRRGRSLATIALMACGIFLIVAVAANRQDAAAGSQRRDSGTGGFALYAETSLPVLYDLNSRKGQEAFGLDMAELGHPQFVAFRRRLGEDASCLNLNRAQQPPLLGVRVQDLAQRNAFAFAAVGKGVDRRQPWVTLDQDLGEEIIPAVADQTVIEWGLRKSLGDTIEYVAENGRKFKLKLVGGLANSVLQGNLIISEQAFQRMYPSLSGYRVFLVDVPQGKPVEVAKSLTLAFEDVGGEVQTTMRRLADFNAVENTYLSIFQALGGLGLVLGSIGMGLVALRNILERRGELALLQAVGFGQGAVRRLLFYEHGILLVLGGAFGSGAALCAVLPAVLSPGMEFPVRSLAFWVGATVLNGVVWIACSIRIAIRRDFRPALRGE
jgi:putative ABC transport system permease protein